MFIERVEELVHSDGLPYVSALVEVAAENDMDPVDLAPLVTGTLLHKLEIESIERRSISGNKLETIFRL